MAGTNAWGPGWQAQTSTNGLCSPRRQVCSCVASFPPQVTAFCSNRMVLHDQSVLHHLRPLCHRKALWECYVYTSGLLFFFLGVGEGWEVCLLRVRAAVTAPLQEEKPSRSWGSTLEAKAYQETPLSPPPKQRPFSLSFQQFYETSYKDTPYEWIILLSAVSRASSIVNSDQLGPTDKSWFDSVIKHIKRNSVLLPSGT